MIRAFLWLNEYGDNLEFYRHIKKSGMKGPMDDEPSIDYEVRWFLTQFRKLDLQRNGGPLLISTYLDYFKIIEPLYELDVVVPVFMNLDTAYISNANPS